MNPVSPLALAIQARDLDAARAALQRNPAQGTEALPGGLSPLLFALYNGAADIAELLRPLRPLDVFEAAAIGDTARLAALLSAEPALLAAHSVDGWTPLHLAAFMGRRDAVLVLIGLGADLDALSQNPMRNAPLHATIAGSDGERLAPLLIALGADVRAVDGSGVGTLHLAASRGFDSLCRLLLARGVDPGARTGDGRTAAALAAERGHADVAGLLSGSAAAGPSQAG